MEIIKETLPNGLTVILAPMEGCKTICELFITKAGWKYEQPKNAGISHFNEHVFFRGTERRPTKKAITSEVQNKGGTINAFTEDEYTGYWVKLAGRFINIAHDVVSDIILHSKFDPEGIEIERGPILEELHMLQDNPETLVADILWPNLLYGKQPAGQVGIGSEETITKLTREQLLDYIAALYVGPNAGVVVAGEIENPSETIRDLNHYFREMSQSKPSIEKPPVKVGQRRPKILFEYRNITQANVMLGVRAYNIFHPDRYIQKVLEAILGGNMSSRMFTEVREKRGLAYDIGSGSDFQTDAGSLNTWAGLNSRRTVEALEVMMEQYRRVAEKKVPEKELRGAKDFIIGTLEMSLEESDAVARFFAEQFVLTNEIETFEKRIERFETVTADDIQRVAQDIFQDKNLNLAIIGPHRNIKEKIYPILKF